MDYARSSPNCFALEVQNASQGFIEKPAAAFHARSHPWPVSCSSTGLVVQHVLHNMPMINRAAPASRLAPTCVLAVQDKLSVTPHTHTHTHTDKQHIISTFHEPCVASGAYARACAFVTSHVLAYAAGLRIAHAAF